MYSWTHTENSNTTHYHFVIILEIMTTTDAKQAQTK